MKATRVDPAGRYQTVREMHLAVERFLDGDRDMEQRRRLAGAHAKKAEGARGRGARGQPVRRGGAAHGAARGWAAPSRSTRRTWGAMQVLTRLMTSLPARVPREVVRELNTSARRRIRYQLTAGIRFDFACMLLLAPISYWMGLADWRVLAAALSLTIGSVGFKVLAGRGAGHGAGPPLRLRARTCSTSSRCSAWAAPSGRSSSPPVLMTFFTLGYCMSPIGRYRTTILATGCLALLGPPSART